LFCYSEQRYWIYCTNGSNSIDLAISIQSLLGKLEKFFLQNDVTAICGPQQHSCTSDGNTLEPPRYNQHIGVELDDSRLKVEVCIQHPHFFFLLIFSIDWMPLAL
jgi:hypothetical protein